MSNPDETGYDSFYEDDSCLFGSQPLPPPVPKVKKEVMSPRDVAERLLLKYFGHNSLRPTQWEIISWALRGEDVVVVMPTGYGKSLCYQMPALIRNVLTVVISPLISLMEDQVNHLKKCGITAEYVSADHGNRCVLQERIQRNEIRFLYLTPEMVTTSTFIDQLKPYINYFTIDEAHCISQWGHEFRHAYRNLSILRKHFPGVPIMALTATATQQVRQDIARSLSLKTPKMISGNFDRENLYMEVRPLTEIHLDLSPLLTESDAGGKNFGGPAIVYCPTRARVVDVDAYLKIEGVNSVMYHAGLSKKERSEAQRKFSNDEVSVIVATVAFGMGIDKKDVRTVIHYGSPKNIESYYQEIGRAGRDGFSANCIAFYCAQDLATKRRLIVENEQGINEKHVKHLEVINQSMEKFLITAGCRRRVILNHFEGERRPEEDPKERCCNNCTAAWKKLEEGKATATKMDFGPEARLLCGAIRDAFRGGAGVGKAIDFLSGTLKNSYLEQHRLYGKGTHRTKVWWKALAQLLRSNNFFESEKLEAVAFVQLTRLSEKGERFYASGSGTLELVPTPALIPKEKRVKEKPAKKGTKRAKAGEVDLTDEEPLDKPAPRKRKAEEPQLPTFFSQCFPQPVQRHPKSSGPYVDSFWSSCF
ncbi:hypothetical protein L596_008644 [Steinernema carpocapsae]|uniref:ATP-dependent DNA helicase n=1 Tax=Steinernema carpocapsae TaxID=34508 RepID=A0A4U5PDD6_STECR|nr:hypothetical protein L596_008644 [Steinernema carpocapsae]